MTLQLFHSGFSIQKKNIFCSFQVFLNFPHRFCHFSLRTEKPFRNTRKYHRIKSSFGFSEFSVFSGGVSQNFLLHKTLPDNYKHNQKKQPNRWSRSHLFDFSNFPAFPVDFTKILFHTSLILTITNITKKKIIHIGRFFDFWHARWELCPTVIRIANT